MGETKPAPRQSQLPMPIVPPCQGLNACLQRDPGRRSFHVACPYMMFFVFDFSSVFYSFWDPPLGGLWNEGERSEPSGTTRPAAGGDSAKAPFGVRISALFNCCVPPLFMLSLLRQGTDAGAPANGAPAVCASSFNPRTVCSQSVAQPEPRTSSAPNSNRCLNCGSGHKFACIRMSQITLTRHY